VNYSGQGNTACGALALFSSYAGSYNTASGYKSLYSNTDGNLNVAFGSTALYGNTIGRFNAALGAESLYNNTSGNSNTVVGYGALFRNTSGSNNVAVGALAGNNVTTGSNNIHIGTAGSAGDNAKIRIGNEGTQTATYIAGISGTHVTGAAVYVTSTGQLGILASSERYKTAIASMGSRTEKLGKLRPVTFHLKTDPKGAVQYGLIAEEVAQVYPELVVRDNAGRVEGVRYEELAPMLLNELQIEHKANLLQRRKLEALQAQVGDVEALRAELTQLRGEMRQLVAGQGTRETRTDQVAGIATDPRN
jgi:hypothetical protein